MRLLRVLHFASCGTCALQLISKSLQGRTSSECVASRWPTARAASISRLDASSEARRPAARSPAIIDLKRDYAYGNMHQVLHRSAAQTVVQCKPLSNYLSHGSHNYHHSQSSLSKASQRSKQVGMYYTRLRSFLDTAEIQGSHA